MTSNIIVLPIPIENTIVAGELAGALALGLFGYLQAATEPAEYKKLAYVASAYLGVIGLVAAAHGPCEELPQAAPDFFGYPNDIWE